LGCRAKFIEYANSVATVDESTNTRSFRHELVQQSQSLRGKLPTHVGDPSDVSAWSREARDQACLHRVAGVHKNDRYGLCGGHRCPSSYGASRDDNDRDSALYEIHRKARQKTGIVL